MKGVSSSVQQEPEGYLPYRLVLTISDDDVRVSTLQTVKVYINK